MAESSLSSGYADIRAAVAHFLGYGRDSANWTANEGLELDAILKKGLRWFYWPQNVPGSRFPAYDWSFLHPVTTLDTVADTYDYDLPDDFGGFYGDFTYALNEGWPAIKETNEGRIRAMRAQLDRSARPEWCAMRPLASDGTNGQRFEVIFYPTPDTAYTLTYRYHSLPEVLLSTAPYPLGGAVHADTIEEACLAAAELTLDDEEGVHMQAFLARLQASIDHDRTANTPQFFGYNGDSSVPRSRQQDLRVNIASINSLYNS